MSAVPKKIEKPVVKKVFKVRLEVTEGHATIIRPNMPMIYDSPENAAAWISANGFKAEDIEVIGDKPSNWNTFYPAPVIEAAPVVEQVATVFEAAPVAEPVAPVVPPEIVS
jgi:hypothetical protein